jgi:hypothetical protein
VIARFTVCCFLFFSLVTYSKAVNPEYCLAQPDSVFRDLHMDCSSGIPMADHSIFDRLLKQYVSTTGKVNYKAIKKNQKTLDLYLLELSKGIPDQASDNEKLAFWINAYNAFTIKMIITHYPVKSIKTLHKGKPWDHKWITINKVTYSLNDIEHKIIRARFKDPRFHFAINCASVSCPPLRNKAYSAENLDLELNEVTSAFINGNLNQITASSLKLSPLFDWYREDFGDIHTFISKYSIVKPKPTAQISFLEYNWNLNE